MKSQWFVLLGSVVLGLAVASCGGSDDSGIDQPSGGAGGSGTGGMGGTGGTGGIGGTGGTGGTGGATGGSAGVAGTGGSAGQAGTGGAAGSAGTSGAAGSAGTSGAAGSAGTSGAAGSAGTSGAAGSAGTSGAAGSAGTSGAAGSAGTSGAAGSAGSDAGVPCTTAGDCDDGVFCNGTETCENDFCVAGSPPDCADNISCTTDFCSISADQCAHVPQDSVCSDGQFCTGVETCSATDDCQAGVPPACKDGLACTHDSCDEINDTCSFLTDDWLCNDSSVCTGTETCDATLGCVAGTPLDCDDEVVCTTDSCDAVLGCQHSAVDAVCDDDLVCNGAEFCDLTAGCSSGAPPCQDDNVDCTIDCNEGTGLCTYAPDHTLCPGQVCDTNLDCVNGTTCIDAGDCDDGLACNGDEVCGIGGVCEPGTPIDCNDDIGCTADSCDDTNGVCNNTPSNVGCSDGDYCNGSEVCDTTLGCQPGAEPDCDDGVPCTIDTCSSTQGDCVHTPDHPYCDDGFFCNGWETCSPTEDCVDGTAVDCPDDGFDCTEEACSETAQGCTSNPNSALCADPNLDCVPGQGCVNTCVVGTCQGKIYECGDCLDNDGDLLGDSKDPHCLGACDNTEANFYGGIPGQNAAPCKQDCYFDQDTGSGNDDCYWSHECDPLEIAPDYPPEGSKCEYDSNTNLPGYGGKCDDAFASQSAVCLNVCLPLTPNGCDCFGCCEIPGAPTTVWLGSEGTAFCDLDHLTDDTVCKPCTVVPSCWNECGECELCVGKTELPSECTPEEQCPAGIQACGLPGQDPCPESFYCVTGCCQPLLD